MNYNHLTQEQLWTRLKDIDHELSTITLPKPQDVSMRDLGIRVRYHLLHDRRRDVIYTFINVWGYNPDNLATRS